MYAQDGEFLPPNASKVTGRDAIKAAWQAMFQIPGVGLTFTTDKFVFGKSADLAVDIGSYDFKSSSGASSTTEKGKSVVTWVKRDGTWQVLTDMFSSDAPMLQSTPSPTAAVPCAGVDDDAGRSNARRPASSGNTWNDDHHHDGAGNPDLAAFDDHNHDADTARRTGDTAGALVGAYYSARLARRHEGQIARIERSALCLFALPCLLLASASNEWRPRRHRAPTPSVRRRRRAGARAIPSSSWRRSRRPSS